MKRIIMVLILISCGKPDQDITDALVGSNPATAPIAHYEGECITPENTCPEFMHLEVKELEGRNFIKYNQIIVEINSLDDAISIDKNGLTCNYLLRVK